MKLTFAIKPVVLKQHTTAMVAFDMSNDPLGETVESGNAHITLLLLGDIAELPDMQDGLTMELHQFAIDHAPIIGKFNGFAVFPADAENDNLAPVVALFDSPELPAFRQALLHTISNVVPSVLDQNHGFIPHMTLRYVNQSLVKLPTDDIQYDKTFNAITLYWGDEKRSWELSGQIVEKEAINPPTASELLDERINMFNSTVDALSERLYSGSITVGQWTEDMKVEIKALHTASAAIGKGGWENVTQSDWGRVGAEVKKQYRYLQGFADDIVAQKDTISLGYIEARSHMYGEAAKHTAALMQAGDLAGGTRRKPTGYDSLPWMPGDGSTRCLTNCKCHWELTVLDTTDTTQLIQAVWTLGAAEHCPDCVDRENFTTYLTVPLSWTIPEVIGW